MKKMRKNKSVQREKTPTSYECNMEHCHGRVYYEKDQHEKSATGKRCNLKHEKIAS